MRGLRAGVGVGAIAGALGLAFACRSPTEVTLALSTSEPCGAISEPVGIVVGAQPDEVEATTQRAYFSATTSSCDSVAGDIGTLVVTPGEGTSAAVSVVVAIAPATTAGCVAAGYAGCIVARRRFSFVDHVPLRVPIELSADCAGVACTSTTTCLRGACVSSEVACSEGGCVGLEDGGADGGADGSADGGADGSAGADAGEDGGLANDPACGPLQGSPMRLYDFRTSKSIPRYCVDRTEVTQAQYQAFLATNPTKTVTSSQFCDPQKHDLAPSSDAGLGPTECDETTYTPAATPNLPVVCVDLCDAATYCASVGKRLCDGTYSEWVTACQDGVDSFQYPYGQTFDPSACNGASLAKGATVDVGTMPRCTDSDGGKLFDMSGNVWEWTASQYGARGGDYGDDANHLGCLYALGDGTQITRQIGFRCCRTPP